jgi:hypothetical protein
MQLRKSALSCLSPILAVTSPYEDVSQDWRAPPSRQQKGWSEIDVIEQCETIIAAPSRSIIIWLRALNI